MFTPDSCHISLKTFMTYPVFLGSAVNVCDTDIKYLSACAGMADYQLHL